MSTNDRTPTISPDKQIFRGDKKIRTDLTMPPPPPWRAFNDASREDRGARHRTGADEIDAVNLAIYLRRPLLITGKPGTGKTSLAYAVARELGLGEVLLWSITSRSTLQEGLYRYDAIGRLQDASLRESAASDGKRKEAADADADSDIGQYIRLGALGAAFQCSEPDRPRVLLIDEIDKSDLDLPNDLLHIFEEGSFEIPELVRLSERASHREVNVNLPGGGEKTRIKAGVVQCTAFPIVFLTSNDERDFPPAFQRRCVRLDIREPGFEALAEIVENRLGPDVAKMPAVKTLIEYFLDKRDQQRRQLATDQLLNAIQVLKNGVKLEAGDKSLLDALLRDLSGSGA